jgi:DNA-binding response OmpR family regulator
MALQRLILLIENQGKLAPSFGPELESKGYRVTRARSGEQIRCALADTRPDIIILNTTYSPTNGARLGQLVRTMAPGTPFVYVMPCHRTQPPRIRAETVLKQPFTIRKLVNRIERLLPSTDGPSFQAGPIVLYVDKRTLSCNHRERSLTPKQAQLLELFMRHQGEVLSRREIMKTVWETDFMEDTRTLDVHIRWVREAIETDPGSPRLLTTIRGKGYCFAIPTDYP